MNRITLKIETVTKTEKEISLPSFFKSCIWLFGVYSEDKVIQVYNSNNMTTISMGNVTHYQYHLTDAEPITESEFEAALHKAITSLPTNPSFAPEPVLICGEPLRNKSFPKEQDDNVIIDEIIERKYDGYDQDLHDYRRDAI